MTDAYERAKADDAQWEREHGDTREKLEADVSNVMEQWFFDTGWTGNTAHGMHEHVVMKWLDRQAAITEREMEGVFLDRADVVITRRELEKRELQAKVDELQAELDAYDQTHMVLPVDADGVPIKIGDKIQQLNHAGVWTDAMPVIAVDDHGCFALAHGIACDARTYVWGNNCRHVKPRTVEDVLRDCCNEWNQHLGSDWEAGVYAKHAAEIRELMGVCDEQRNRIH